MTNTELKEGMTIKLDADTIQCINELKPCDDEYGMHLGNLFDIMRNQTSLIYGKVEKVGIAEDAKTTILNPLWQIDSLLDVLQEKVGRNMFLSLEKLIYYINQNASK